MLYLFNINSSSVATMSSWTFGSKLTFFGAILAMKSSQPFGLALFCEPEFVKIEIVRFFKYLNLIK